jgi:acetoin utilization deacetylase AcuC-like enzyme
MLKKTGIPIVCVLEGGYDLKLLSEGICETIKGLLGEETMSMSMSMAKQIATHHKSVVDDVCEQIKLI